MESTGATEVRGEEALVRPHESNEKKPRNVGQSGQNATHEWRRLGKTERGHSGAHLCRTLRPATPLWLENRVNKLDGPKVCRFVVPAV